MTFTAQNWETAQTITVTAVDDNIDEGTSEVVTHTHTVASTDDSDYDGLSAGNVSITITDNDTAGVTVTPTSLPIVEGLSDTYTVKLASQPTHDVTVTINDPTDNTDVTAEPATLTFTPVNWHVTQTVTVSAAHDSDAVDESARVTHAVASTDSLYDGISASSVAVILTDDEDTPVKVSFEQGTYVVTEGGKRDGEGQSGR